MKIRWFVISLLCASCAYHYEELEIDLPSSFSQSGLKYNDPQTTLEITLQDQGALTQKSDVVAFVVQDTSQIFLESYKIYAGQGNYYQTLDCYEEDAPKASYSLEEISSQRNQHQFDLTKAGDNGGTSDSCKLTLTDYTIEMQIQSIPYLENLSDNDFNTVYNSGFLEEGAIGFWSFYCPEQSGGGVSPIPQPYGKYYFAGRIKAFYSQSYGDFIVTDVVGNDCQGNYLPYRFKVNQKVALFKDRLKFKRN